MPERDFIRIHRSYTIAIDKIDAVEGNSIEIEGLRYVIGRSYIDEVKQKIFDLYLEKFGPMRARRQELVSQPEYIDEILKQGAEKARKIAQPLLREVRAAVGIPNR